MASSKIKLLSFYIPDSLYQLPSRYEFLYTLGEGSYGQVLKCWDKNEQRNVAIKIPKLYISDKEIFMLREFQSHSFDKCNIVQFFDSFNTQFGRAIVFETLDISLQDYILKNNCAPMLLSDIRTIIQQLTTALQALKSIGVIHADVKPDNIMMVDHLRQPFGVKLIDFGLAIKKSRARQGLLLQTLGYRSPEVMLGLPLSEAIDMWSLGCLMALMITGFLPFHGRDTYESMQFMIDLLGQPAGHLLNDGKYTKQFFDWTEVDGWRLKKLQEPGQDSPSFYNRSNDFPPLDDLKKLRLESRNEAEAEERQECTELLKAMLEFDANKRITPSEVLTYPFFYTSQDNHSSYLQSHNVTSRSLVLESVSEHSGLEASASGLKNKDITSTKPEHRKASLTIKSSRVIMVKPARAENQLLLDCDLRSETLLQTHVIERPRNSVLRFKSEDFKSPFNTPRDEITNIQPDHSSTSLTNQPSHVITDHRPDQAENQLLQDCDVDSKMSLQAGLNKTSESIGDVTENNKIPMKPDNTTSSDIGTDPMKKKKKKKNIFRRFFSRLRKSILTS